MVLELKNICVRACVVFKHLCVQFHRGKTGVVARVVSINLRRSRSTIDHQDSRLVGNKASPAALNFHQSASSIHTHEGGSLVDWISGNKMKHEKVDNCQNGVNERLAYLDYEFARVLILHLFLSKFVAL